MNPPGNNGSESQNSDELKGAIRSRAYSTGSNRLIQ